jgi:hypothetical protein
MCCQCFGFAWNMPLEPIISEVDVAKGCWHPPHFGFTQLPNPVYFLHGHSLDSNEAKRTFFQTACGIDLDPMLDNLLPCSWKGSGRKFLAMEFNGVLCVAVPL